MLCSIACQHSRTLGVLRGDPLHQAACILDALRQRQAVYDCIAQGACRQRVVQQELGIPCTGLRKVARLQLVQLCDGTWQTSLLICHLGDASALYC